MNKKNKYENLINSLKNWDENQLSTVLGRIIPLLRENANDTDLLKYQRAIYDEFQYRLDKNKKGVRPELGILGICGYHVGNQSKDEKYRRQILDYIVLSELPKIGSPVYMDEWGLPNSSKRMEKLIRVLSSLKRKKSAINYKQFEKAIIEWGEDLEYIKRKFSLQ